MAVNMVRIPALLTALAWSVGIQAAEHEVGQRNKAFEVDHLTIAAGDTVHFPNHDPFFHNIFSLSDTALFDLGSYAQGESKSFTFEEKGEVEVECAIHPNMRMTISVE